MSIQAMGKYALFKREYHLDSWDAFCEYLGNNSEYTQVIL